MNNRDTNHDISTPGAKCLAFVISVAFAFVQAGCLAKAIEKEGLDRDERLQSDQRRAPEFREVENSTNIVDVQTHTTEEWERCSRYKTGFDQEPTPIDATILGPIFTTIDFDNKVRLVDALTRADHAYVTQIELRSIGDTFQFVDWLKVYVGDGELVSSNEGVDRHKIRPDYAAHKDVMPYVENSTIRFYGKIRARSPRVDTKIEGHLKATFLFECSPLED